jgi:hypothetical protein
MCPGGATCLPVDYCLSEVALLENLTKLVGLVHGVCRRVFVLFRRKII